MNDKIIEAYKMLCKNDKTIFTKLEKFQLHINMYEKLTENKMKKFANIYEGS